MKRGIPREVNADGVAICFRGHLMTPENTYNRPNTTNNPQCRQCRYVTNSTDDYTRPDE